MSGSKQITLLGAKGMLGTDLTAMAVKRGWSLRALDLPEFDITQPEHLERAVSPNSVIVNCAAYTNVEKAESEPELAEKVNAWAVGRLGELAKRAGARVLHISTDFVFDGMLDRPYVETDIPNPINAYGLSKWHGELALEASGCQHCILRIEWTYGRHGVHFIKKLMEAVHSGEPLRVVDDQVGAPTATTGVAEVICNLLEGDFPEGVFHFAAWGYVSRYGMAQFIFDTLEMPVELTPCKTADFPSVAKRPLNSRFNCKKIKGTLGRSIEHWKDTLAQYLET